MNATILAIDDEPLYLGLIELFLRHSNYNLTTLEGGTAALDYLRQYPHPIHLILLDLMMPDLHGLDVLHFIRNHPHYHSTPVILQTATPNEEEIQHGFALGASGCIRKPYNVTELLAIINNSLHAKNSTNRGNIY